MATVRPFRALRPAAPHAKQVAALPYDVMGREEAKKMVEGNPFSFLHVDKAEIDLDPSVDPYDPSVYRQAAENLDRMAREQVMVQDLTPCYYIYRLVMDGISQTGVAGCASIDDYRNNIIKKHEFTRKDKEQDRIRHVDALDANTGPIFLTCRPDRSLDRVVDAWCREHKPVYDFTAEDGVDHTVWIVDAPDACSEMESIFGAIPALYIADGHHRAASAVRVGEMRRGQVPGYTGEEEFNFFLSVIFPSDQLRILDYNRVAADLNGLTAEVFLGKVEESFTVIEEKDPVRPEQKHQFGMYLEARWYRLTAKPGVTGDGQGITADLDVSVLQDRVLAPVLGIADPRTDQRIDFVGGIRGLRELERRVSEGMAVAFSLHPPSMEELMSIADADAVMPPKSTWFEPKLRSGLLIHKLEKPAAN